MTDKEKNKTTCDDTVFKGKYMRENASWIDVLLFNYSWPLIESSMKQKVKFEHYGELPDRLKIKHEEKLIEESVEHYLKIDPNDKLALGKGLMRLHFSKFVKYSLARFVIQSNTYVVAYIAS